MVSGPLALSGEVDPAVLPALPGFWGEGESMGSPIPGRRSTLSSATGAAGFSEGVRLFSSFTGDTGTARIDPFGAVGISGPVSEDWLETGVAGAGSRLVSVPIRAATGVWRPEPVRGIVAIGGKGPLSLMPGRPWGIA